MKAKIIRLDPDVEIPKYHTAESAGFDIASSEDAVIAPRELRLIKTGLVIQAPVDHYLHITARSSLAFKKGLMLSNGVGTVDRDYCGPEDEIKIAIFNFSDKPAEIKKGERLVNGIFLPVTQGEFEEVKEIKIESRGGYGSTGGYQ